MGQRFALYLSLLSPEKTDLGRQNKSFKPTFFFEPDNIATYDIWAAMKSYSGEKLSLKTPQDYNCKI